MNKILITIQPFVQLQHINCYNEDNDLISTDTCILKALPEYCKQLSKENPNLKYIILAGYSDFSKGIAKKIKTKVPHIQVTLAN